MLAILEENFNIIKEVVDENVVSRRLEDELGNVLILEEAFFPPDNVESKIYVIKGKLDINLETKLKNFNCEIIKQKRGNKMKTRKIIIQMMIPEERHCLRDCECCEYYISNEEEDYNVCSRQNADDLDTNLIWKIERYITNGIVVTKTFVRNVNSNDDYIQMSAPLKTEQEYQETIKILRDDGYEVINF